MIMCKMLPDAGLGRQNEVIVTTDPSCEIDFIATRQENKLYIQVAQEIGLHETEKREYGRLLDIRDNYPNMYCGQIFLQVVITKESRLCISQISC